MTLKKPKKKRSARKVTKAPLRASQTSPTPPPAAPKPLDPEPRHQQRWLRWGVVVPAGAIGLIESIYQLSGGPPAPVDPEVHPVSDGSSLIHPFTIRNRSGLFDMPNVRLSCGVDLLFARDATGKPVVLRDTAAITGTASISAGSSIPYQCDTSKLFKRNPDGSLNFNGANTQFEHSSCIQLPLEILKTCVWIGGKYSLLGVKIGFTSKIFQWPDIYGSKSRQWAEGEPVGSRPEAEIETESRMGLSPGALRCSPKVDFVYGLTTEDGRMLLMLPPDPMGTLGAVPLAPTL
jgi:hypothetical protein